MGRRVFAAAVGAFIGGFGLYLLLSNLGGGLDWEDRLTLGQSGELGLEGMGIFIGLVAAAVVGAPLGTYIALKIVDAKAAAMTAWGALIIIVPLSLLAPSVLPTGPKDPVVLPWVLFGGWGASAAATRALVERSLSKTEQREIY